MAITSAAFPRHCQCRAACPTSPSLLTMCTPGLKTTTQKLTKWTSTGILLHFTKHTCVFISALHKRKTSKGKSKKTFLLNRNYHVNVLKQGNCINAICLMFDIYLPVCFFFFSFLVSFVFYFHCTHPSFYAYVLFFWISK